MQGEYSSYSIFMLILGKINPMKKIILATAIVFLCLSVKGQSYEPTWESIDSRAIPSWFEDAKFGIFIHWGVYSVPAYRPLESAKYASYAEWYYARVYQNEANGGKAFHEKNYGKDFEYRQFAPMFRAELWDPDLWAGMFKDAGAKYVVLTTKHHDGFCLWPTKSPYKKGWNAMDVGPKRDLVGDLSSAVRNSGLKMGLYYSIPEWESSKTHRSETGYQIPLDHVKKYKIPEDEYVDKHLIPQLKELVTNYKPSLIFSDAGEWDGTEEYWKTKEFLAWLYNDSPVKNEVVVNDRFAKDMPGKHGDYFSSEYQDASVGEHPWEESRGVGGSYGYNRAENLDDYQSSRDLIIELIDIVSRGGNLLLNVGPTADGRIPVIQQQRLRDIGDWLRVNGDAIYGSRKSSKYSKQEDNGVYYTQGEDALFAIFTKWPDGKLVLSLDSKIKPKSIRMLGVDQEIKWKKEESKLIISLPQLTINKVPCLHAWSLKIELE